jgi:hypothetical protein
MLPRADPFGPTPDEAAADESERFEVEEVIAKGWLRRENVRAGRSRTFAGFANVAAGLAAGRLERRSDGGVRRVYQRLAIRHPGSWNVILRNAVTGQLVRLPFA